ncbi:MAG TPA: DNA recombination protein RmuC [Corynebacteriales bacterium]|nr:DNA recombination protein RmuC [Mycobacteriales bacterium]
MVLLTVGCSILFFLLGGLIGWLARGNAWATQRDIMRQTSLSGELLQHQADSVSDAVMPVIHPLTESLHGLNSHMEQLERQRLKEFSQLTESVLNMQRTSRLLSEETNRLASALRSPNIRGQWGEMQLERVVELSGMAKHCDFDTQHYVKIGSQQQRPDLVVKLSRGRTIVIDAKVPFDSYLTAINAQSDAEAEAALRNCVKSVKSHIDILAKKSYWTSFVSSPEFVVMFVPGDAFLDTVLQAAPELLDYAFKKNVVLATPTTLIALLRTVALTWQHDRLTEDARDIQRLGQELYDRIDVVTTHLRGVGTQLGKAVDSYNSALSSIDSRLVVTARKLRQHGIRGTEKDIETQEIDSHPRAISDI